MKYFQPYGVTDPDAGYENGDASIGVEGSIPPAGAIEQPQREIVNALIAAGLTPSDANLSQLAQAIPLLAISHTTLAPYLARGALAERGSASTLAIATGTSETAVTFNVKPYDTDSVMNLGGDATKMVVPAGVSSIRIQCQVLWEANATGFRKFRVLKNATIEGAGLPSGRILASTSDDVTIQNGCGAIIGVTPGDYFQLMVSQSSGGNLNIRGDSNTWMVMEILK